MQLDYEHWFEVLLAVLAALGAWLWRVGRLYQRHEDRVRRLEEWRSAHSAEHNTESDRLERKIDELNNAQNDQNVALSRIESAQAYQQNIITDIRKDVRAFMGAARPGGNRSYDPPLPPGGQ